MFVTGVQSCALPIWSLPLSQLLKEHGDRTTVRRHLLDVRTVDPPALQTHLQQRHTCEGGTEGGRDSQTERERETHREGERHTERERDSQRERETHSERERERAHLAPIPYCVLHACSNAEIHLLLGCMEDRGRITTCGRGVCTSLCVCVCVCVCTYLRLDPEVILDVPPEVGVEGTPRSLWQPPSPSALALTHTHRHTELG